MDKKFKFQKHRQINLCIEVREHPTVRSFDARPQCMGKRKSKTNRRARRSKSDLISRLKSGIKFLTVLGRFIEAFAKIWAALPSILHR